MGENPYSEIISFFFLNKHDKMVLWNGAREILHLFCCLNGKHPHTTLPFLVLDLFATDSTVCPPIWWCPPPDATILGGF